MLAKLLCTKRKSASAPRCLRCLGATIDIVNSITRTANRSGQGVFSHRCLRKANTEDTVITGLGGLPGITAGSYTVEGDKIHQKPTMALNTYIIGGDFVLKITRLDKSTMVAQIEWPPLNP